MAIMDRFTRKVLSWRLFTTMAAKFCIKALQNALTLYGASENFNTDQGSQLRTRATCQTSFVNGYGSPTNHSYETTR